MIGKWIRLHGMEANRWLANPWFLISAMLTGVLIVMAVLGNPMCGDFLTKRYSLSALYFVVMAFGGDLIEYVGLCLCTFFSAGIFAEDYEENALYMRVQRIGTARYSYVRVLHTFLASWLCAFLGMVFAMLIIVVLFGQPFFPELSDNYGWVLGSQQLLLEGKFLRYFFYMAGNWGFCAAFYGLLELLFSSFLTNRKALYILPLLLWYFNQYMLTRIRWIPAILLPSQVFANGNWIAVLLGESDGIGFLYAAGYTLLLAVIVFFVLWYRISRYKAFGRTLE